MDYGEKIRDVFRRTPSPVILVAYFVLLAAAIVFNYLLITIRGVTQDNILTVVATVFLPMYILIVYLRADRANPVFVFYEKGILFTRNYGFSQNVFVSWDRITKIAIHKPNLWEMVYSGRIRREFLVYVNNVPEYAKKLPYLTRVLLGYEFSTSFSGKKRDTMPVQYIDAWDISLKDLEGIIARFLRYDSAGVYIKG